MKAQEQIATYQAQAEELSSQRSWIRTMAQQVSAEEQRERCVHLAEKLTKKIESLNERIAKLNETIASEAQAVEPAACEQSFLPAHRRCRESLRTRHEVSEYSPT